MLFAKTPTKEFTPPPFLVFVILVAAVIGSFEIYDISREDAHRGNVIQIATTTVVDSTSSPQEEISDWKTYRNEEHGFEFKLPVMKDGTVGEMFIDREAYVVSYKMDNIDRDVFTIDIGKNEGKSLEEWIKNDECNKLLIEEGNLRSYMGIEVENLFFSGSLSDNYLDKCGPVFSQFYINSPDKKSVFVFYAVNQDGEVYNLGVTNKTWNDFFKQILSTFKFISTSTIFEIKYLMDSLGYVNYYHPQLVQKDGNSGKEIVLVDNILESLPELKSQELSLRELSINASTNRLFFYSYRPESDGPRGNVYSFNLETKKFFKLDTATRYYQGFGDTALSPDGRKVVTISNPDDESDVQKIYLLDLINDQAKVLVSLKGKESITFCSEKGDCWANSNQGNLKWIDDRTLEYAVYDSSKFIEEDPLRDHPIIEKRRITIQ